MGSEESDPLQELTTHIHFYLHIILLLVISKNIRKNFKKFLKKEGFIKFMWYIKSS